MRHRGRMLGVFRETRFSPKRVKADAAILERTAERIRRKGFLVRLLQPREFLEAASPTFTFAMCEGHRCLRALERWKALGHPVFNHPAATRNCHRWRMLPIMAGAGVRVPRFVLLDTSRGVRDPFDFSGGVWIKRWDVQSTRRSDVRICYSRPSLNRALSDLRSQGVKNAILQEHIPGDLIKLYGIRGTGWFHCLHIPQEGAKRCDYSPAEVHRTGEKAAQTLGLDIYGADLVVTGEGHYLIDVNSWPSFAPCRDEAAERIAAFLVAQYERAGS